MTEIAPTLESAYRNYRGLLFGALAKLAAQGFVAQPTDAADLVHDFFVEAWPGIAHRFNPQQASFPTYMYAAFVRFARPRIVRLQRQRGALLDPAELIDLADATAATPGPEHDLDLRRVRECIAALPASQRNLLDRWLNASRSSEREVARDIGVSRYEMRQRLIEALGQVSTALGALSGVGDVDRDVALAIWRDGLTVRETAARLGLTPKQVRNAYGRNQQRIQRSLSLVHPAPPGRTRSATMSEASMLNLLRRIFEDPTDEAVVSDVERHAAELVQYLAQAGDAAAEPWRALPADRVARVYEAIARGIGGTELLEIEAPDGDALFKAHADDRRAVGRAFAEALVPALPRGIRPLLAACGKHVDPIPPDARERLQQEPDVVSGGDDARALTQFGLTPTHLVLTADAVAMQVERAIDAEYFPRGRNLVFRRKLDEVGSLECDGSNGRLSRVDLTDEICAVASTDEATSLVLLDWLVDAAPHVNALFGSFTAATDHDSVVLTQITQEAEPSDLYERWSPRLEAVTSNDPLQMALQKQAWAARLTLAGTKR